MKKSKFTIEKKMIAQVRFYETLYKIRDEKGEAIYTGSEEAAKKILRILNSQGKSLKARK